MRLKSHHALVLGMFVAGSAISTEVIAQIKVSWPYPQSMEAVNAAPKNHIVRYENDQIRLLEVVIRPGETENMHGHQYPSVFAYDHDGFAMKASNAVLDPQDPMNNDRFKNAGQAPAPQGAKYPTCRTLAPEAPHAVTNRDTYPDHFYRLEFKRLDGDDIKTRWKEWYPWLLEPTPPLKPATEAEKKGKPLSKDWPWPMAYDPMRAAPDHHYVRYEDDHIRLLEVVERPGQYVPMHGHQYSSVFAIDSPVFAAKQFSKPLDPSSKHNTGTGWGLSAPPSGMKYPICATADPESPSEVRNDDTYPIHFWRLEFKRIDGDGFKTHWKQWYPWAAKN